MNTMQDNCWYWARGVTLKGYGRLRNPVTKRKELAHRFVYEALVGPIPEGLELDHLCKVTRCINPEHLEPVTTRENVLRSDGVCAKNARKTHCVNGHTFKGNNLRRRSDGGRRCLTCLRDAATRFRNKKKLIKEGDK